MSPLSHTPTLFTAFLALCLGIALCPSIHAQAVIPNAFVDGQTHYIFGGINGSALTADPVMIDLTVSWNTSSPAIEKLPNRDATTFAGLSTTLPNGNIFTFSRGNGYVYNVRTYSWTIDVTNLPIGFFYAAVSDMETGIVYIPIAGLNTNETVLMDRSQIEVDMKTKTITPKAMPVPYPVLLVLGAWSASLRSILYFSGESTLYTFTPSKVNGTSDGWGRMATTGDPLPTSASLYPCLVSAHNGSTIILVSKDMQYRTTVHVLDVLTRTWKSGPLNTVTGTYACSVSGDQLITWGTVGNSTTTTKSSVSVYNMKTEKWVTTYTAPPPQPTQPDTNTDSNVDNNDDHSNKKVIIIIVIVTGVLLAITLTVITAYIGATKRSKSRGKGTSSDGSSESSDFGSDVTTPGKVLAKGIFGLRNPVDAGVNSKQETLDRAVKPRLNIFGRFGRLHQGSAGALEDTGHPHAVVEELAAGRNVQEGTTGARFISQHPHANFMDAASQHPHANVMDANSQHPHANFADPISQHPHAIFVGPTSQHPHVNVMDTSMFNDKEELTDSTIHVMEELRSTAAIHNDKAEWNEE
ncbi:hypothetical protein B0O80DRAFT_517885 [Mortierella sp. GBAus27b]|nr:hypothetical protein BGX31_006410 [Mortierella sp. GBA43]KAI8359571.1 hypothetical protein B0O80DRAFT_517885 [Mortierella sp. GBAus27b]